MPEGSEGEARPAVAIGVIGFPPARPDKLPTWESEHEIRIYRDTQNREQKQTERELYKTEGIMITVDALSL